MKLAYLICFMVIFATVANAFIPEKLGRESDAPQEISPAITDLVEMLAGQDIASTKCAQNVLNVAFETFAFINLILHGTELSQIFRRLFQILGDLHALLVECGVI